MRGAAVLAVALLTLAAGGASAAETRRAPADAKALPSAEARYDQCLALARAKPQEALGMAETWRDTGGGFPAEHCAAVALIGLHRYVEAAKRLEALAAAMMQADPVMRAMALEQAGQAWLLQGDPRQAKAAFDGALALKPGEPDLLIDRAQAYAEGGQYRQAVADLTQALKRAPDRVDALVYRASAYRRIDALDDALIDIDRAIKLAPHDAAAYLERGNIRQIAGDAKGARADWQRVSDLAPGTATADAAKANLARLAAAEGK